MHIWAPRAALGPPGLPLSGKSNQNPYLALPQARLFLNLFYGLVIQNDAGV